MMEKTELGERIDRYRLNYSSCAVVPYLHQADKVSRQFVWDKFGLKLPWLG